MLTAHPKNRVLITASAITLVGIIVLGANTTQLLQGKPLNSGTEKQTKPSARVSNPIQQDSVPAQFADSPMRKLFTEKFQKRNRLKELPVSIQRMCAEDMTDDPSRWNGGCIRAAEYFDEYFDHAFVSDDFIAMVVCTGGYMTMYHMLFFNIENGEPAFLCEVYTANRDGIENIASARSAVCSAKNNDWRMEMTHRRKYDY